MTKQTKVKLMLTSFFILCLILLLLLALVFPSLFKSYQEKMMRSDEMTMDVYAKKAQNNLLMMNITAKVLGFLYVLWPILAALAYKRTYLSKGALALNLLAPWILGLTAHYLPVLGIRAPISFQLSMYVYFLVFGSVGSFLVLAFLPTPASSETNPRQGENTP